MGFGWQEMCRAALRENDPQKRLERLAAAQKIIIQRFQELAPANKELPEIRALREALDSLYGVSPQQPFCPGELADEEHHPARWMRIAAGVCAALMMGFATGWMIHNRSAATELQRLRGVEARAHSDTAPSMIAEVLGAPPEVASAAPAGRHVANPSSNQPGPSASSVAIVPDRNRSTTRPDNLLIDGADATLGSATLAANPVPSPASDRSENAISGGATPDETTQAGARPATSSSTDSQQEMQTAPSPLAATEESKPLAEPNTEERAQSTPAEAPAVQKTSEILQGSVSTEMSRYPAIRISPELKKQAAQSGASLQIGEPISQLSPVYPEEAERQGIEGTVQLRALVGKDGAVENVEVVNGPSLLATAAVNAIRQWHFRPTLLGDQPIEVTEEITVVFRVRKTSAAGN